MNKILIVLLIVTLATSCEKNQKIDVQYVSQEFTKHIDRIEKLQYDVQKIMTFSSGDVWDNKGFAVLKREPKDTLFGFSFFGLRNEINKSSIYNNGIGFQISNKKKKFKQEKGSIHFLGSPGGQMIYKDFFKLDTIYENAKLIETEDSYVISYTFKDDLKNKITDKQKVLELDKITFLPKKVTISSQPDFGDKQSSIFIFNNLKINEKIDKDISEYINDLNKLALIKDEKPKPNALLKKPLPLITLKKLLNENQEDEIKSNLITLIDFWEVWCGPCIASLPKIEELKNKFPIDIKVIGIVSEDKEAALKLVGEKEITFLNFIGNKELKNLFNVNSFPRYFLVDRDGIIQKEYHGFSKQIERDIQKMILE